MEDICRICWQNNSTSDNKLSQRCHCKSLLIHDNCLKEWIKIKKNNKCEICLQNFNIETIVKYKSNEEVITISFPFFFSLLMIFITTINILPNLSKNQTNFIIMYFFCLANETTEYLTYYAPENKRLTYIIPK